MPSSEAKGRRAEESWLRLLRNYHDLHSLRFRRGGSQTRPLLAFLLRFIIREQVQSPLVCHGFFSVREFDLLSS